MASVHKEILIEALPEHVWAAIRDYGDVRRLVPAVVDCRLEGNIRIVTFPDGRVAREILVDINDARRRLVYAESGDASSRAAHRCRSLTTRRTALGSSGSMTCYPMSLPR
jgi:hypothetical protein